MLHGHRRQLFGFKAENLTTMREVFIPSYKKVVTSKAINPFRIYVSAHVSDKDPDFSDFFLGPFNCVHNDFPVNSFSF